MSDECCVGYFQVVEEVWVGFDCVDELEVDEGQQQDEVEGGVGDEWQGLVEIMVGVGSDDGQVYWIGGN